MVWQVFSDISKLWFLLHNIIQMSYECSHYYFLNSSSSVFPDMYYFNVREILCSLFLLCVHVCVYARWVREILKIGGVKNVSKIKTSSEECSHYLMISFNTVRWTTFLFVRIDNYNKRTIYIRNTHTRKECVLSTWDKNERWTIYNGQRDKQQYWCLIKNY